MLMFCADTALQHLAKADIWMMDGIFDKQHVLLAWNWKFSTFVWTLIKSLYKNFFYCRGDSVTLASPPKK